MVDFLTGSPSDEAGLMNDDCIVRINGQNVSRSTAESVARIVRYSESRRVNGANNRHRMTYDHYAVMVTIFAGVRQFTIGSAVPDAII